MTCSISSDFYHRYLLCNPLYDSVTATKTVAGLEGLRREEDEEIGLLDDPYSEGFGKIMLKELQKVFIYY